MEVVDDADESGEEDDCARASSLRQPGEQDEVGVKADALQARAGFLGVDRLTQASRHKPREAER